MRVTVDKDALDTFISYAQELLDSHSMNHCASTVEWVAAQDKFNALENALAVEDGNEIVIHNEVNLDGRQLWEAVNSYTVHYNRRNRGAA